MKAFFFNIEEASVDSEIMCLEVEFSSDNLEVSYWLSGWVWIWVLVLFMDANEAANYSVGVAFSALRLLSSAECS